MPIGIEYILFDYNPIPNGFKFSHDPYSITTKPIVHNLCGQIAYEAYFDGNILNGITSLPMIYDSKTGEFQIYSEDLSMIGLKTITLKASLEEYLITKASDQIFSIEIVDPCISPVSLSVTTLTDTEQYFYTEEGVIFGVNSSDVDPWVCQISFACVSVTGDDPRVNCTSNKVDFN